MIIQKTWGERKIERFLLKKKRKKKCCHFTPFFVRKMAALKKDFKKKLNK